MTGLNSVPSDKNNGKPESALGRTLRNWADQKRATFLVALLFIGLLSRFAGLAVFGDKVDPTKMDTMNYRAIARSLVDDGKFSLDGENPTTFVAPGYPVFMTLFEATSDDPFPPMQIAQLILSALMVLPIFFFARSVIGSIGAAIAALIWSIHPELIGVSVFFYPETLFLVFFALFLLPFQRGWGKWTLSTAIIAGLLVGVATLVRPVTMLILPFLAVWIVVRFRSWLPTRWIVVSGIAFGCVVLPWTYRNYHHFEELIPVASGAGSALFQGTYLPFDGRYNYEATRDLEDKLTNNGDPIERDKILREKGIENIKNDPAASAWLAFRKIGRLLFEVYGNVPQGEKRTRSWLIAIPLASFHYVLMALAAIGLVVDWRRGRRFEPYSIMVIYFILLHIMMLAIPRYRMPMLPLLVTFAAMGLVSILRLNQNSTDPSPRAQT